MYNMEIKKIEYGAYLSYDLYGGGEENLKSRNICTQIKNKNVETIESIINEMKIGYDSLRFKKFFDSDTCLIPIPGSSKHSNSTSVAKHIADVMVKYGFCKNVINCIKRTSTLKSSFSDIDSRPTITQQYGTLSMDHFDFDGKILLVDDVITTGTIGITAANLIYNHTKNKNIRLFTIMRTLHKGQFNKIIDPVISHITINGERGDRDFRLFNF